MARKHAKSRSQKCTVTRTLVKPAVYNKERICTEVPEGTDGAIPIKQEDGSTKFFVVSFKEVSPAVYHVKANGPTTKGGQRNDPKNMAPKGKGGSAPLMRKKGT